MLVHAKIGRNEDPSSKCDDFRRIIDQGLAGPVDIALFKLCYIDIHPGTDAEALATTYMSCLDELSRRHPETIFLPVTAPLRQTPGGPGVWAREFLGRTNHTKVANARRHAFNERLRTRYGGRPLFDLAASEATGPERPARDVRAGRQDLPRACAPPTPTMAVTSMPPGSAAAAIDFVHALAAAVRIRHAR